MKTQVICRWMLGMVIWSGQLLGATGSYQDEEPARVAGQDFYVITHRFSIAEKIFSKGFYDNGQNLWAVLDLGERFGSFTAQVGVFDDSSAGEGTYSLKIDGREVKSGSVRKGRPAIPVSLDLRGCKSMRIQLNHCVVADWAFSKAPPEDPGPTPLSPEEDVKLKREAQPFVWRTPPGASAYTLEIVAMQLDQSASSSAPRTWCYALTESRGTVDLSKFPTGEYRWSILAFDDRKMLGKRGLSRRFTLIK